MKLSDRRYLIEFKSNLGLHLLLRSSPSLSSFPLLLIVIDHLLLHSPRTFCQGFFVPLTKHATLSALAEIVKSAGVEVKALSLQGNHLFHLTDVHKTLGGQYYPVGEGEGLVR